MTENDQNISKRNNFSFFHLTDELKLLLKRLCVFVSVLVGILLIITLHLAVRKVSKSQFDAMTRIVAICCFTNVTTIGNIIEGNSI